MSETQKIIKIIAYLLAISIIIGICTGVFNIINAFIPTTEKIVVDDYYKEFTNIRELNMSINAADLIINEGETFSIKAEKLVSKIIVKEDNGKIKIKQNKVRVNNNSSGLIVITIPSTLNKLYLDGGAGHITINDIKSKSTKLSLGFGQVDINNVEFGNTDISGGAGNIEINKSTIEDLKLDSGAGRIKINAELKGESNIDCGVGEMNILLLGGEDNYKIKAEKGIGNITIDNKNYGDEITYGKGKNYIKINGGVGNVSIRFQK